MNKLPTLVCLGVLTLLSFGVQAQIVNPALSLLLWSVMLHCLSEMSADS